MSNAATAASSGLVKPGLRSVGARGAGLARTALLAAALAWGLPQSAWAGPPGRVFILGAEVKLRSGPGTGNAPVGKVTVGTECALLEGTLEAAPDTWLKLSCGELTGHTLRSLVTDAKPDFDALLAQAQDPATPGDERFNLAWRAAALKPDADAALDLMASAWLDQQLAGAEKLGKRRTLARGRGPCQGGKDCARSAFDGIAFEWMRFADRGTAFVCVSMRQGAIQLDLGTFQQKPGDVHSLKQPFALVQVKARSTPQLNELLVKALARGALKKPRAFDPFADAAVVGDEAAAVLRRIPRGGCRGRGDLLIEDVYGRWILSDPDSDTDSAAPVTAVELRSDTRATLKLGSAFSASCEGT